MDTASLTIPSPKRIEFNCGKSLSLTIVRAATVSVAQRTLANTKHSTLESIYLSGRDPKSHELVQINKSENIVIEIKVPITPKIRMKGKFFMKFLLLKV